MNLQGQQVVVCGAGLSGRSAAQLARRRGADVTILDQGTGAGLESALESLGGEGIQWICGKEAAGFSGASFDLAVLSPGIPPDADWIVRLTSGGLPLIGEIELAATCWSKPIYVVTGTNGKTTTTGLTAHLLSRTGTRCVPSGNYGRPFSDVALEEGNHDCAVVEVSSFQMETIRDFHPRITVWLNFAPDHMDRYATVEEYHAAKTGVFRNQTGDDWAVVNALNGPEIDLAARRMTFSSFTADADFTLDGESIRFEGQEVATLGETRLIGRHNAENMMAALATLHLHGTSLENARSHLGSFQPPRHRCELVAEEGGVVFINDSKATNLHALVSSLRSQTRPVVLILGGKEKGLDYSPLLDWLGEVRLCVAIGEIRPHLIELVGDRVPSAGADNLEEAVALARASARHGDAVLFSPGTSSFDMFSNYEQRGDAFCQAVLSNLQTSK